MTRLDTGDLAGADTERGRNMATASGLPFWPMTPKVEDIRIEDIAASLSRLCRFNGHLRDDVEMYSVAQHSVLVSYDVPSRYALEGLLHDAAEAYVGDCIKPLKMMLPEREVWEHRIDRVIRLKFDLPGHKSDCVRAADYRAVLTERRDVLPDVTAVDWGDTPKDSPWPQIIRPWYSLYARNRFMARFKELTL